LIRVVFYFQITTLSKALKSFIPNRARYSFDVRAGIMFKVFEVHAELWQQSSQCVEHIPRHVWDNAAELLGMKPTTLASRMKALGIKRNIKIDL
jgi:hypothetical protein